MKQEHIEDQTRRVLERLRYWQSSKPRSVGVPLEGGPRYLTFEVDCGGFNNIRQAFEYAVIVAAVSGRTLVLPPPRAWYLINYGPGQREGDPGRVSHLEEFFDIGDLCAYVPVMSANEFADLERGRLRIPTEFFQKGTAMEDSGYWESAGERWYQWLRSDTWLVPWNPYYNVIFHPDIHSVLSGPCSPDPLFMDNRVAVEIDDTMAERTVLHLPCDRSRGIRHLGQVSSAVAFDNREASDLVRRLLRNGVHYLTDVFSMAAPMVASLGLFRYASLHIRRNDFQFQETRIAGELIDRNISKLLNPGEPLYVATDESDPGFLEPLRRSRPVYTWSDLSQRTGRPEVPSKLVACVEQVICAGARLFVGTRYSTMSSYVVRLRGYIGAPNTGTYFHTEQAENELSGDYSMRPVGGRDYLREDARLWQDARTDLGPDYTLVCTDTHPGVQWQCELLEHTFKQVGQPGRLVRLVATDSADHLPSHPTAEVIHTRFSNVHPETADHYPPYNRLYSIQQWLTEYKPVGTVLILDPDYVFRAPVTGSVPRGAPVGQYWVSNRPWVEEDRFVQVMHDVSSASVSDLQKVTWPALIHSDDLKRLMPRWIELTSLYRQRTGAWESDMIALVVAAAEIDLRFDLRVLAAWMDWPEHIIGGSPLIHYCQRVKDAQDKVLWWKWDYRPWQTIEAKPQDASLNYCRELLGIVKRYVAWRRSEGKSPRSEPHLKLSLYLKDKEPVTIFSSERSQVIAELLSALQQDDPPEQTFHLIDDRNESVHVIPQEIIALDIEPVWDAQAEHETNDWVEVTVRITGLPDVRLRSQSDGPAIEALKAAMKANLDGDPDRVMFIESDKSERIYLRRSSLRSVEITPSRKPRES